MSKELEVLKKCPIKVKCPKCGSCNVTFWQYEIKDDENPHKKECIVEPVTNIRQGYKCNDCKNYCSFHTSDGDIWQYIDVKGVAR